MSCIATFYLLPEARRAEFETAKKNEPTTSYERRLVFFKVPVISGGPPLYEYLDGAATSRLELPYSGFAIISYLFNFRGEDPVLVPLLKQAEFDEYFHVFSPAVARSVATCLSANPPVREELQKFAREEESEGDVEETVSVLTETHRILAEWFSQVREGQVGILHLSF